MNLGFPCVSKNLCEWFVVLFLDTKKAVEEEEI